uniref:G-protein coupled receptors family 1 profile domain-containing protein n=1 Tax=Anopheles atroparvus TaxID=41427 RepID=A0A182JML8_ANOAO
MSLLMAPLPLYYATAAAAAVVVALPSTVASETGGAIFTALNRTLAPTSSTAAAQLDSSLAFQPGGFTDGAGVNQDLGFGAAVSAGRAASDTIEPSPNAAGPSPAAFTSSNVSAVHLTGAINGHTAFTYPTVEDDRFLPLDRDPVASTISASNQPFVSTVPTLDSLFSNASTAGAPPDPTARQLDQTLPRAMEEHFLIANWQDCVVVILFCLLIVVTVIGNTLVILSVITTRRLRTVTNCFVMSLAVADWLVGIFVMPPAVAVHLMGSWQLGWILCDIWISLDVLLCTASILSLCAISIDRYLAVTQPLNYSRRRRSKRLALLMILVVWVLALAITCPPILGWYEPGRRELDQCRYNQNEGYVVFSAMGSFFIPMTVMVYVYLRISCVVASRHDKMTEIEVHKVRIVAVWGAALVAKPRAKADITSRTSVAY